MREIFEYFWNNDFAFVGTVVFLAGLLIGSLGLIERKRKQARVSRTTV